jgi:hypothetical protein
MQQYVNSLATVMHLTNYLSTLNQNLKATTSSSETQNAGTQRTEEQQSKSCGAKTKEKKSTVA